MQLITVEEMDDLPDDPSVAFVQLERICRSRLTEYTNNLDNYNQGSDLRIEYMTVVGAAAKAYGVADIGEVTEFQENNFSFIYQNAISIATRLQIESKIARSDSLIAPSLGTRERLKRHIEQLINGIESSDLSDRRKDILRKKAQDLSQEIDKERMNLNKILIAVTLIATTVNQVQDSIIKLPESATAIMSIIGREKMAELEAAPAHFPKVLPAPIKKLPPPSKTASGSSFPDDLDDEVPF